MNIKNQAIAAVTLYSAVNQFVYYHADRLAKLYDVYIPCGSYYVIIMATDEQYMDIAIMWKDIEPQSVYRYDSTGEQYKTTEGLNVIKETNLRLPHYVLEMDPKVAELHLEREIDKKLAKQAAEAKKQRIRELELELLKLKNEN